MYGYLLPDKLNANMSPQYNHYHLFSDALLRHVYFTNEKELILEIAKILTQITVRNTTEEIGSKINELKPIATNQVIQMLNDVNTPYEYNVFKNFKHFNQVENFRHSVETIQSILEETSNRLNQIEERLDEIKDLELFEDNLDHESEYLSLNYKTLLEQLENFTYNGGIDRAMNFRL